MPKNRSIFNYIIRKYIILPFKILKLSILDTIRQDGVEHAGYLAFLGILSLFPFLIFLVSIVGFVGASEAGAEAIGLILSYTPKEVSQTLTPRIQEIISGPPQSFLTIAILGVIWTASSSVEGCRTILNRAYRIEFPPPYIFRRFISIIEFFIITFSIVTSIVIFVIAPRFLKIFETNFGLDLNIDFDFYNLRQIIIFTLLILGTSLLYYVLPNAKQKISQTIPGSILTVSLWILLEKLFVLYLKNFHQISFVYGSLAGIIISLTFFYLLSLAFIIGAEFNYHFHRSYNVFLRND